MFMVINLAFVAFLVITIVFIFNNGTASQRKLLAEDDASKRVVQSNGSFVSAVNELHSYATPTKPEVVLDPRTGSNEEFISWLDTELAKYNTKPKDPDPIATLRAQTDSIKAALDDMKKNHDSTEVFTKHFGLKFEKVMKNVG